MAYIGSKHMHNHYEPGGFPRIWTASAFTSSPKRDTELDYGQRGKWSIEIVDGAPYGVIKALLMTDMGSCWSNVGLQTMVIVNLGYFHLWTLVLL